MVAVFAIGPACAHVGGTGVAPPGRQLVRAGGSDVIAVFAIGPARTDVGGTGALTPEDNS
jgi:hypothetical protein